MAEERKPKIDLKARLGKKTVASKPGAPSIPPPVGIPKPPGMSVPPFGSRPSAAPARVDASDPYAAIDASVAPARPEPQAIKIEMSEEVVQAQKRGRNKVVVLAAVTAAVGGLLGFATGSGVERGKGVDAAIEGAQDLAKELDGATAQAEALADVLKSAREKLSSQKFPEEELSKLGGINIPFEGSTLTGKGIGRFPPALVTQLIDFAGGAQQANEHKEQVQAVLGGSKAAITEFLEVQTKPKVRWSVYVTNGPGGPWAAMQPLPEPFLARSDEKQKDADGKEKAYSWPEEFKITPPGANQPVALKRYTTGEPGGSAPKIIPVDPSTQGAVCPSDVAVRLRRELSDLENVLRGDKSDPANEKAGLIETGRALQEKLKGIGAAG
jgi:hypothetical protein